MRLVVNIILALIIVGLLWVLYQSIREPIAFKAEKDRRELAVVEKLQKVRTAQELFRDIKGGFAPNFDTLAQVLREDSFTIVSVIGNPDDPENPEVTYDTMKVPAIDSVTSLGLNLDSLRYVPFGQGAEFEVQADTALYQSIKVNVVQVGARRKVFMGRFADPRFARYDQGYDPEKPIKFGDLNSPKLAGNWE